MAAVQQRGLEVHAGVARQRARLRGTADAGFHRRNELARYGTPHDAALELHALAPAQRLQAQGQRGKLPGPAGLLLVNMVHPHFS
jgi:hypothetical protein